MINSLLSGLLLALAFPKAGVFWLAWLALVPFFVALLKAKNLRETLLCGGAFGAAFWALNFLWVFSLWRFAGAWVLLGWIAAVLFQTLFILLFSFLFYFFIRIPHASCGFMPLITTPMQTSDINKNSMHNRGLRRFGVFVLALLWVLIELLRNRGPLGVPLGVLGYTQVNCLPILQLASFSSVYGLSCFIVLVNLALAYTFCFSKQKSSWLVLGIVGIMCFSAFGWGSYVLSHPSKERGEKVKIAVIQPNISQMEKMDPLKVVEVFNLHEQLTRQAFSSKPDIIIWPETAIFTYVLQDPSFSQRMIDLVRQSHAWFVIGTPYYDNSGEYNALISLSPSGEIISRYYKERLVPFGEYLPWRALLYPLLKKVGYYDSEFHAGSGIQGKIAAGRIDFASAICSESADPSLVRKRVNKTTTAILTVTNDSWFDNSSLPYFHLQTGILRAVENRKYFVQAGNSGISSVVDSYGRILKQTKLNERTILAFQIPLP
jgi:apolipoprotein N-acyltransferase